MDFSHSFYETHLAIAVKEAGLLSILRNIATNRETLFWLGIVLLLASAVGGLFYALEHRVNPKLYSRKTRSGRIIEGFILGLLFITRGPVNYYEFQTLTGRVLTVLLAVGTTLFIASFTAVLASAFTIDRLRSNITGPADLAQVQVAVKSESTAGAYLDTLGIAYREVPTVPEMLGLLAAEQVDAVVADDPVLRYLIKQSQERGKYTELAVLPYQFDRQNYGIVLPEGSVVVEDLNRAILAVRDSDGWYAHIGRHLGTIR